MEAKNTYLERLPYWGNLSETEKNEIRTNSSIRHYVKGEFIHGGCEECLGQIVVVTGEVRTYLISEEGREITLFTLEEGDPCVLSASCVIRQITFETQMIAKKDTDLLVIHVATFSHLVESNIYVKCFMYELATQRFSSVMWTLQQILFSSFDRRLAAYLIREAERTKKNELNMTHEQIAENVNSAREVVARMLKRFSTDGLVETQRGIIVLKDMKGLKELAQLE